MNRSNVFGKKRFIDKFYEDNYGNKNVQVPKNNSSDKKVTGKFQIFFLVKVLVMPHSEATNKRCSAKISVLQKSVLECSFSALKVKNLEKLRVKDFIFIKVAGLQPTTLLKNELLTSKFQGY